jgi:hypothetical protein
MSDDTGLLDLTDALPCAAGAAGGLDVSEKPGTIDVPMLLGELRFRYIGKGLTGPEFEQYVQSYDFGSVPPDQLIIHNTYIPDASWASVSANQRTWWDRNEAGLAENQIYAKRAQQLDGLMRFYRDTYGWDRGPHLFVDERWIWLFTPMYDIGIHAAEGNSYRDKGGRLHYSIGIETVGYFTERGWHPQQAALLRQAVQALARRLKTFQIVYKSASHHHPELHQGSIAFHSDYNKAACPGRFITPAYAIGVLAGEPPTTTTTSAPRYRVKRAVTAGATIRSAPRRKSAVLGRLRAGDAWAGDAENGEQVTLAGFGTSKIWIHDPQRGYVWAGLLDEVEP